LLLEFRLEPIAGVRSVNLFNSQGNAWTADYLKIKGELDVDMRSNIAAEARAEIVYERLINFCDDAIPDDPRDTNMKAFSLALTPPDGSILCIC
jgi:manganese catalase